MYKKIIKKPQHITKRSEKWHLQAIKNIKTKQVFLFLCRINTPESIYIQTHVHIVSRAAVHSETEWLIRFLCSVHMQPWQAAGSH